MTRKQQRHAVGNYSVEYVRYAAPVESSCALVMSQARATSEKVDQALHFSILGGDGILRVFARDSSAGPAMKIEENCVDRAGEL